jgi:hypothetical protein
MPFFKQRNRVVVFRLSQEEYDNLKAACAAAGGRNVSEYTRSELLASIQSDSINSLVQRRFGEVDRKLADLQELVREMSARMNSPGNGAAGVAAAGGGRD